MSSSPDSTKVYVANQAAPSVSVIATATNTVSATLAEATVGKAPFAVLATPSPYFYKLQAGHGGWQSPLTAAVSYQSAGSKEHAVGVPETAAYRTRRRCESLPSRAVRLAGYAGRRGCSPPFCLGASSSSSSW